MAGPVFAIPLTFSESSGGRTRAVFQRASILATAASPVTLLTFNFRTQYPDIVHAWRQRTSAGRHVHHLNLFEHFAEESIFDRSEGVMLYEPPSGVKARFVEDDNTWVLGKGPNRQVAYLHPDGTLMSIRQLRDGAKVMRTDVDAQQRPVRRLHFEPDRPDRASLIEYVTHDDRVYLQTRRDGLRAEGSTDGSGDESSHQVIRPDGQRMDLSSSGDLWARFIADLAQRHPDAVFIVDDRKADEAVTNNPWIDRIPSVAAIHSSHRTQESFQTLNAAALARSDQFGAVVVLTREQAADAVRDGLVDQPPSVIPHAAPARRRRWWARPRIDVVMVARLTPIKQVEQAISAFGMVVAARPSARMEIWGTGELADQLESMISEAGLSDSIAMKGYTDDPLDTVARGRLSIFTSRAEGFGLVMAEALSQGVPAVSYRYAYGPEDMIEDGVNGVLVPADDPAALAAAVVELLADPRRLRQMSRAAGKSMQRYRVNQFRASWNELLDQVRSHPGSSQQQPVLTD